MRQKNSVIVNRIRTEISDGATIPKPNSSGSFTKNGETVEAKLHLFIPCQITRIRLPPIKKESQKANLSAPISS